MPKRKNENAPFWQSTYAFQKRMIESALLDAGGVVQTTAARLGISRTYLHKLCADLDIDTKAFYAKQETE